MAECTATSFADECLTCSIKCCVSFQQCWTGCSTIAYYHTVKNALILIFSVKALSSTSLKSAQGIVLTFIFLGAAGDLTARSSGLVSPSGSDQWYLTMPWLYTVAGQLSNVTATSLPFLVIWLWVQVVMPLDPTNPRWGKLSRTLTFGLCAIALSPLFALLPDGTFRTISRIALLGFIGWLMFSTIRGVLRLFRFVRKIANYQLENGVTTNGGLVKSAMQLRSITKGVLISFAITFLILPIVWFADEWTSRSVGCEIRQRKFFSFCHNQTFFISKTKTFPPITHTSVFPT